LSLAEAQVAQAEAELAELEIRRAQTEIMSPLTGTVGERHVDPGALVTSSTPIVLILSLSKLVTVVNVPERDINQIQVGNLARVVVDAVPGEELAGRVVRISPILDAQTRTAPVEIEVANTSERLKAEMFARVDLNLTTERPALLIPRDALVYRGARPGVFVVESDVARFQVIETGLAMEGRIEVRSGLSEGMTVVTRGANLLKNGDTVQILHPEVD
jgi:RND family efflux transporter MFP subunit